MRHLRALATAATAAAGNSSHVTTLVTQLLNQATVCTVTESGVLLTQSAAVPLGGKMVTFACELDKVRE